MLIHLLIFSLAFTGGLQQTSKPDFTGIWNARIVENPNAAVEGLNISYTDPKLEVVRFRTYAAQRAIRKFVYYTDGRGETQKPIFPNASADSNKSKTQRVGEKFVITETVFSKQSGRKITTDRTVTLEVSSDGKTLTETTTFVTEGNTQRLVHLYERGSGANTSDINGEWIQKTGNRLISLIVEHHEPEIKVTRRVVSEAEDETEISVYYTDGRGEINVSNGTPMKSITKWKDQNLTFIISNTSKVDGDTFKFQKSMKWEMSSDGNSLIEAAESRMSASAGFVGSKPDAMTLVYARSLKKIPQ
jgi:hypothetical protein